MPFEELGAQHRESVPPPAARCSAAGVWHAWCWLDEDGADQLREAVACPIQPALDRTQVATGDLGDLLIALPLELAEHEHFTMMLRQALDALVDRVLEKTFAIQVIRPSCCVLELQRAMIGFPVLLDGLEQHQRIAAAVAQLVLRQIRRDRINPRRELFGLIEAVQMPEHPDEDFLYQVFRPFPVTDGTV